MNSDQIIDILAVRYSMTNRDDDLEALIEAVKPIIKAKAHQYAHYVPTTTRGEFEALFYEDVWKACRGGKLANFDPTKGSVMQRLFFYWRATMYREARKARGKVMDYPTRNSPVSLDAMLTPPACLWAYQPDTVDIEKALKEFSLIRPMDVTIVAALIDGLTTTEIGKALGRGSYDAYARQRVCRARKAFGAMLCR